MRRRLGTKTNTRLVDVFMVPSNLVPNGNRADNQASSAYHAYHNEEENETVEEYEVSCVPFF